MSELFLRKIKIDNQFVKNLEIPLSGTERKHLIITGKNGSGKTTVLRELNQYLEKLLNDSYRKILQKRQTIEGYKQNIKIHEKNISRFLKQQENANQIQIQNLENNILKEQKRIQRLEHTMNIWEKEIKEFSQTKLNFNSSDIYQESVKGNLILAFFGAKRENIPDKPKYIENINLPKKNQTSPELHIKFIKFLVRLRNTMLNEQFDGDQNKAGKIKKWFENFENTLKKLFQEENLKLKYLNQDLNFKITYDDREFGLNELSDGYSSLLAIVTELILRMEAHEVQVYDMQGVVLIDEIETHLHVELQKKVLPFLIDLFPRIQFIVTTHSPFVLHSLKDSVICDLERKEITSGERFSNASYSEIVKNYFEVDSEFSEVLLNDLEKYENLIDKFEKNQLNENDEKELFDLDIKLDKISPMLSDEVYLRFRDAQDRIQE